jgi:hypothetical protein
MDPIATVALVIVGLIAGFVIGLSFLTWLER